MAVLSDYTSGRISLANGSTTVTGTGTLFNVAKFREGDTLQIQNLTAVIASVNSDTSLTLTAPWTGTTLTNAVYRARYLPDGARVTAQATTLIEVLGNGKLQSIAGLTGAADKGLMLTGPETAGTFDLTATARVLLRLAGTAAANKLPFLDSANSAALADLSPYVRTTLLALTTQRAFWDAIAGASTLTTPVGRYPLGNGLLFQYGRDTLDPVGAYNPQVLGGTTYYTHYYRRVLPVAYTQWFIVWGSYLAGSFNSQIPSAGRQFFIGRDGTELERFVMSFVQPGTGAVPAVTWQTIGV